MVRQYHQLNGHEFEETPGAQKIRHNLATEEQMLAPWKKSYDKPDSILKSRDITLLKKVHLVKAMVFPVVMYGCESWTI